MKKSTAVLIGFISAILLALAFMGRSPNVSDQIGSLFLPELSAELDAVTEITIADTTATTSIIRADNQWRVVNRNNYPANVENLRKLLRNLADTTIVERKTNNPALFNRVGLQSIAETSNTTTRHVVVKAGEQTLADFLIGERSDRGSFMRKTGVEQAWLVNRDFLPDAEPSDWIEKSLLQLSRDDLQKIEVQPAFGPAYEIGRDASGEFALQPIPEGREVAASGIDRPTGALRNLMAADVITDTSQANSTATDWAISRWYSRNGLVVSIDTRVENKTTLARISAEASADGDAAAKAQASAINAKTKNRLFKLPAHQSNNLRLTLEQILKPVEES